MKGLTRSSKMFTKTSRVRAERLIPDVREFYLEALAFVQWQDDALVTLTLKTRKASVDAGIRQILCSKTLQILAAIL